MTTPTTPTPDPAERAAERVCRILSTTSSGPVRHYPIDERIEFIAKLIREEFAASVPEDLWDVDLLRKQLADAEHLAIRALQQATTPREDTAELREALLVQTAYMLFLQTWLRQDEVIEDLKDEVLKSLSQKWRTVWMRDRYSEHFGDCTSQPQTCVRCVMDELFENARRVLAGHTP